MFNEMKNPDLYHKDSPWNVFEGWYFKVTDRENSFAFIPGIFHGTKTMKPHAFIQVLDGHERKYEYIQFPIESFSYDVNERKIVIDKNVFSFEKIKLSLNSSYGPVDADISLSYQHKWNHTGKCHKSMGYYNYIPFMECYSQVCLMDSIAHGQVSYGNKKADLNNASTYIEKNWGKQFPYSWIWVQSNLFSQRGISLSASIGHIPMPIGSFRGFLIGLMIKDKFYEFTTMNNSKLDIQKNGTDVSITVKNQSYTINIETHSNASQFTLLNGPKDGKMKPLVKESITSFVSVKLYHTNSKEIIFSDMGFGTGIEFGGSNLF